MRRGWTQLEGKGRRPVFARGCLLTPCQTPDRVHARRASPACSRRRAQEVDDWAPSTADGAPATADGAPATADGAPAKADGADAGLPWPARLHLSNGHSYGVDLIVSAIGVDARAAWLPAELERCLDDGGVLVDACASMSFLHCILHCTLLWLWP